MKKQKDSQHSPRQQFRYLKTKMMFPFSSFQFFSFSFFTIITLSMISNILVVVESLDSLNLDLEILDLVNLEPLGVPNLDRYQLEYNLTVDDSDTNCIYTLEVKFQKPSDDILPGNLITDDFEGDCDPSFIKNAPDGIPFHEPRRYWMPFPEYVAQTTGFNHMSLYWRPCGLPPLGLRKPRYEMNFYTVLPQYRVYWRCQTSGLPKTCLVNQSTPLGRGHFSLPHLERNAMFLSNMPVEFQPDPTKPTAYEYEGLISYRPSWTPSTASQWILPTFQMSTYDGDTVSWRALIPDFFVTQTNKNGKYSQNQFYVYQSMTMLPAEWNVTSDAITKYTTVYLHGSAGMCGESFEQAKQTQEAEFQKRKQRERRQQEQEQEQE